jgi:hypothetical protein
LRVEKDIRLRIDLLEGQSSSLAKMLAKAIREHDEEAFAEYEKLLGANRCRVEELLWVLGEKIGQSVLDLQVGGKDSLSVEQTIEKIRAGELKMEDLSQEAQSLVRKGALEIKTHTKDAS